MDGSQNIFVSSKNRQINSDNIEENPSCNICARTFRTNSGLLQHLNFCGRRNITSNGNQTITKNDDNNDKTSNSNNSNSNNIPDKIESQEKFSWNLVTEKDSNNAYEKTVHWKKNLFMLPSGAAGKRYVEEVTRLMKLWIQDTPLKSISLKAIHVMPALLPQKPSKSSKAKDHLQALTRRITLWEEGNIKGLLHEGMTI